MYQTLSIHIKGVVPCIMHNGQLADPMNEFAAAMKEITSKHHKKITTTDREELLRLEWMGSLYVDDDGSPCWPGENIEAMIRSAARFQSKGKDVERGLQCAGNWRLICPGVNGNVEKLFEKTEYRKTASVVYQQVPHNEMPPAVLRLGAEV